MLTVAKVTGSQALGYADYLEAKVTASHAGDYYLKDGERVEGTGRWIAGATAVGANPVARASGEQLRTLMAVRRPDNGTPLRAVGSTGEAVAALDATFSAPKSVSAVWAVADPELRDRVEQAHETAIDRAIRYATRQVPMVRQRLDVDTVMHVKAREMVATGWRHTTSRAVDGPPDPQLHTHVLLHAAVRRDGQVVAIDSRQWLTHRRELGAAYRTELARELIGLGFAIQRGTGRGRRYFEISGVPATLVDCWSSRHHQVQEAIQARLQSRRNELNQIIAAGGPSAADAQERLKQLAVSGQLTAGEDRFLTHATRSAKQTITHADLDAHWTTTAQAHGLNTGDLAALREPADRKFEDVDPLLLRARLTEHDATLTRSQVRGIALEHTAGLPIRDALTHLAKLRDDGELLALADRSWTTRSHREREHQAVELAQRLAAGDVDPIPGRFVTRHAERLDQQLHQHGGALSDEQRTALALACGPGQLVVIEGQAGTGKSTILAAVALAHQDAGQQIIVTSTAGLAARRLGDDLSNAGVVNPIAHSTVSLQHALRDGRLVLGPGTTVIHDEAALASTQELEPLLDGVENSGARIILVGDPRQSHPVGAGGLWPYIEHAASRNDARSELTHNLRAHDPQDARDQKHFRHGEHERALHGYARRDRLHLHASEQATEDAALEAAHHDRLAGQRTLVIAQTSNEHLDQLNARAQAIRHQDHELGAHGLPLAGRPYRLHAGDEIQLRASIANPQHGMLRNGTSGIITHIEPQSEIAGLTLKDGARIELSRAELEQGRARLAYVQHPFPAQGVTTDATHLIIAEHATREGTYVALTRACARTNIHASTHDLDPARHSIPQIAERVSATDPDLPSIAYFLADVDLAGPKGGRESHDETAEPPPAIVSYRATYGIPDHDPRPLGPEPPAHAFRQRLDRRHAAYQALIVPQDDGSRAEQALREQLRRDHDVAAEQAANMIIRDT